MLRDRLISAACLVSLVTACLLLDFWELVVGRGAWLLPLVVACAGGSAWEMSRIITASGIFVRRWVAVFGACLGILIAAVPIVWEAFGGSYPPDCPVGRTGWVALGAFLPTALSFILEIARYEPGANRGLSQMLASCGIFALVVIPFGFLVVLRQLGEEAAWGLAATVTLVAATKAGDTGAYVVGKIFGKHKLIPRLSPGKTWEGVFGGILLSILVSFACMQWLFPSLLGRDTGYPLWGPCLLGTTCAVAGMLGDLSESLFKREGGLKDSGSILPGMGGVWDVTDSLIGAAVPGYLCFTVGVAGPWT